MHNNKGMTLIEVLLSITILAIASLMLFTCLTNVIHFMNESNKVKNASDNMLAFVEGSNDNEVTNNVSRIDSSLISYTLSLENHDINVKEELNNYQSSLYPKVLLRAFTQRVITADPNGEFNDDIYTVGGDYMRCIKQDSSLVIPDFVEGNHTYEKGSFVKYEGNIYRKIGTKLAVYPNKDKAEWRQVNTEYQKGNYYYVGEVVTYNGNYLQLLRDSGEVSGKGDIPSNAWEKISPISKKHFQTALEVIHNGTLQKQATCELGGVENHTHASNEPIE